MRPPYPVGPPGGGRNGAAAIILSSQQGPCYTAVPLAGRAE